MSKSEFIAKVVELTNLKKDFVEYIVNMLLIGATDKFILHESFKLEDKGSISINYTFKSAVVIRGANPFFTENKFTIAFTPR